MRRALINTSHTPYTRAIGGGGARASYSKRMATHWLALALLLVSLSVLGVQGRTESVSIAAFNIEVFGVAKFSKPAVVDILSRVSVC